ncbi:LacI family DNA-binding transcriptional regulator [Streptomyces sp. NPDC014622]|uniref:LacI family DNA-binding transcriptional regulator n=1 Tax=Streptomyces sp. NPDC014622 TaxID=3364874 RepID=UPI0036F9346E
MTVSAESVRIGDVARHAGVSVVTVSNVLNRPHIVAERTRSRVEDAIRRLGFVPNASARQLREAPPGRRVSSSSTSRTPSSPRWRAVPRTGSSRPGSPWCSAVRTPTRHVSAGSSNSSRSSGSRA